MFHVKHQVRGAVRRFDVIDAADSKALANPPVGIENGPPSPAGRSRFREAGRAYILAAATQDFHLASLSFIHFAAAASASILSTSTSLAMTAMSRLEKLIFCSSL